jgi:hypothetical protein
VLAPRPNVGSFLREEGENDGPGASLASFAAPEAVDDLVTP